ncbi:MAG: TIGR02677 family protein [Opitutales bacterium]
MTSVSSASADTSSETAKARRTFAHLQADKAELYRAILELFVAEKEHFTIALRPGEILDALRRRDHGLFSEPSLDEIESALGQLADWGNLEATPDQQDATTVEDFYRVKFLYQLSHAGEAAEHALAVFDEHLRRPGELQTAALHEIIELLEVVRTMADGDAPDPAKAHHHLRTLSERFAELTSRAQTFIRGVQRTVDLHEMNLEAFLAYKEKLIEYLERFLRELIVATNRIVHILLSVEGGGLDALLRAAADRETVDALDRSPETVAAAEARWRERWQGLRRWFVNETGPSQAELLRSRARSAIPALLATVSNLNDRRTRRTDRAADCLALARLFARAATEDDAHRLWRSAFGLHASRHLRIDPETLDARDQHREGPRTSWLEGVPLQISPRLRKSGRVAARGGARSIVDRRREREALERLAAEESRQIEAAREQLVRDRPLRLSEMQTLGPHAFDLFLDLLGEALNRKTHAAAEVETVSSDGSLRIRLALVDGGGIATLRTEHGDFQGRDHWIHIRRP